MKILSPLMLFLSVCVSFPALGAEKITIVAFGDSLSAGYQLPPADSFPARLEKALIAKGYNVNVINAGVSGDTTSGGLERLEWSVPAETDIVILELGANDALRGISPEETGENLDRTLRKLKSRGILVLIAGMQAPRNLGSEYTEKFDRIFPELARKYDTDLYPFFLDGVALKPELNLSDGMHPNSRGVTVIVDNILPYVEKLLKQKLAR